MWACKDKQARQRRTSWRKATLSLSTVFAQQKSWAGPRLRRGFSVLTAAATALCTVLLLRLLLHLRAAHDVSPKCFLHRRRQLCMLPAHQRHNEMPLLGAGGCGCLAQNEILAGGHGEPYASLTLLLQLAGRPASILPARGGGRMAVTSGYIRGHMPSSRHMSRSTSSTLHVPE